jgi:putative membrane protein
MAFLSQQELQDIRQAIAAAETRTSGELVVVIAAQSDDYLYIPTLWAALIALAVPGLAALLGQPWLQQHVYLLQFATFMVLALAFQWRPLKFRLIPRAVSYVRAQRLAQEQFLVQNLHHTEQRTGVLIFVSVAEHYVEILADKGINDRVPDDTWDHIVQQFTGLVKQGRVAEGFMQTIQRCGEVLAENFPAGDNNPNELPNRLIEL